MHADAIHTAILAAYPDADPQRDYMLRDDGNGPYLNQWNIAGPIPAGVPTMPPYSPAAQWYALCEELCRKALAVVDATVTPSRLYANGLADAIANAQPGEELAPGITLEQVQLMAAAWGYFATVANAPIEEAGGKSLIQIMTMLGKA